MNVKPMVIILIFILFDVITGWLKALYTGTTDSSIMRKGLFHKLGEILALIFGYVCELIFPLLEIEVSIPFVMGIATYIVLMETASVIENIATINPNLSKVFAKFFSSEELKKEEGKQSGETEDESADSN